MTSALQQRETLNWIKRTSGTTARLNAAVFFRGTFVVVGNGGTILTSPNGVTWTRRTSPTTNNLLAVTAGRVGNTTYFVAVGEQGTILVSTNSGRTWVRRNSGTTYTLTGAAFGRVQARELFVVVGKLPEFRGIILTSENTITWTRRTFSIEEFDAVTYAAVTGRNIFVVGGSKLVAPGRLPPDQAVSLVSSDGVNWQEGFAPLAETFTALTSGNRLIVGALSSSTVLEGGIIETSANGLNWTERFRSRSQFNGAAFGRVDGTTFYVVVGESGEIFAPNPPIFFGQIATSTNGTAWTEQRVGNNRLFGVTWGRVGGQGTFIVVGDNGTILQSVVGDGSISGSMKSNGVTTTLNASVSCINNSPSGYVSGSIRYTDEGTPFNWRFTGSNTKAVVVQFLGNLESVTAFFENVSLVEQHSGESVQADLHITASEVAANAWFGSIVFVYPDGDQLFIYGRFTGNVTANRVVFCETV